MLVHSQSSRKTSVGLYLKNSAAQKRVIHRLDIYEMGKEIKHVGSSILQKFEFRHPLTCVAGGICYLVRAKIWQRNCEAVRRMGRRRFEIPPARKPSYGFLNGLITERGRKFLIG